MKTKANKRTFNGSFAFSVSLDAKTYKMLERIGKTHDITPNKAAKYLLKHFASSDAMQDRAMKVMVKSIVRPVK